MKTWKAIACVLAVLAAVPAVQADEERNWSVANLGVGVQYWNAKDLDYFDGDGLWGANFLVRIRPIEYLGIDLRIGGEAAWEGESIRVNGKKYDTDVAFGCVPAEAGLVLMLPVGNVVTLYGGGGVGYYYYDLDVESHEHHSHSNWDYDEHRSASATTRNPPSPRLRRTSPQSAFTKNPHSRAAFFSSQSVLIVQSR